MDITPYRLPEEMYKAIETHFKDERDRDIVVFCLKQALAHQSQAVIDTVNQKIDRIISEMRKELKNEFATKSDLTAVRAILENKITELELKLIKEIIKVKDELKADIAGVKDENAGIKSEITGIKSEIKRLDEKIDLVEEKLSEKISKEVAVATNTITKWTVRLGLTVVGSILLQLFLHFYK